MLTKVMAAFARPTRLVKSQKVDPSTKVDDKLFEVEEERQLQLVYQQVASQVMRLQRHPLAPLMHLMRRRVLLHSTFPLAIRCSMPTPPHPTLPHPTQSSRPWRLPSTTNLHC